MNTLPFAVKVKRQVKGNCQLLSEIVERADLLTEGMSRGDIRQKMNEIQVLNEASIDCTIAFIGGFNSGKTTLINLLTENNFSVTAKPETTIQQEVEWEGFTLIDTPGFGSGQTDHDKTAKDAIARATLTVYILTPEGLIESAAKRLRNFINQYRLDHELMLVTNKIDTVDFRDNVFRSQLQQLMTPHSIDQFRPVFLSSKDEEDARDENLDSDSRNYLRKRSRFDTFITELDTFIRQRQEQAQLHQPITGLINTIEGIKLKNDYSDAIRSCQDEQRTLKNLQKRAHRMHTNFETELNGIKEKTCGTIFSIFDKLPEDPETFLKEQCDQFSDNLSQVIGDYSNRIDTELVTPLPQFGGWDDLGDEDCFTDGFFKHLGDIPGGKGKFKLDFDDIKPLMGDIKKFLGPLLKAGIDIVLKDQKPAKAILGAKDPLAALGKAKPEALHKMVLGIGNFVGFKFKPWGALGVAKSLIKVAPRLILFANCLGVGLDILSMLQRQKAKEAEKDFKEKVRCELDRVVSEIVNNFEVQVTKPIIEICSQGVEAYDQALKQLNVQENEQKRLCIQMEQILADCNQLSRDIFSHGS